MSVGLTYGLKLRFSLTSVLGNLNMTDCKQLKGRTIADKLSIAF